MHEFLVSIVAFIVLIAVMVIVHELGHFIVAKLCRVRVEAFSFGFGPRLFGFKYGETDYKVCLLPLGGFVKMTGEAPEQNLEGTGIEQKPIEDDPGSFTSHPRWQRILIGLAGPAANFVLALVLMFFYYGFINEVPSVQVNSTSIEWVVPGSAAAEAGLQTGDVVTSFGGAENPEWFPQVYARIKLNPGQYVPVTVLRAGQKLNLSLLVPAAAKNDDYDISDAGILPQFLPGPIQVTEVADGTPAAAAGLKAGDGIVSVDGHAFHWVGTIISYLQEGKGKPIQLVVARNGAEIPMTVTPAKLDSGWKIGFSSVMPPYRAQPLSVGPALKKSLAFTKENSWVVFTMLNRLFTHKASVTQLVGPVGIARVAGDAAEMNGWLPKFNLAGMISLNLGILNLMPFPILDGGMILLLLIESVLRRDISSKVKERIYQGAFVILMAFFVFIIFNDVSRLPLFSHLKL